mmetsp:Transcript_497/g.665  ORF Transcript_497/g.665 Transcript_497/m.665 type:complete len:550 (+) Transcript_497:459-2108(+)
MLYGSGFQTWEYSPEFALRSYAYLVPHAIIGEFLKTYGLRGDKVFVFYGIKAAIGLMCGFAEAMMYRGVIARFGKRPASYFLLFQILSAGMYHAGVALLPSTTCMILTMVVWSGWMHRNYRLAIYSGLSSVLLPGWPFIVVIYVPFGLYALADFWIQKRFFRMVGWSITSVVSILLPVILAEKTFYGKDTIPMWNIFVYNVLGEEGRGDELYGVEPLSYYLKNLFLNLNFGFLVVLFLPIILAFSSMLSKRLRSEAWTRFVFTCPAIFWMGIMFVKPHKEERFLFPVYPLIYLGAALTLDTGLNISYHLKEKHSWGSALPRVAKTLALGALVLAGAFSMSRVSALLRNFSAPCRVYEKFYYRELPNYRRNMTDDSLPIKTLCVGGEWHRFPASFFLPSNRVKLAFLPSDFKGQLPQPFREKNGTFAEPLQPFNDLNKEEPSRYTTMKKCDYITEYIPSSPDATLSDLALELGKYIKSWDQRIQHAFLDQEVSPSGIVRSFLVPFTQDKLSFGTLVLFKKKDKVELAYGSATATSSDNFDYGYDPNMFKK